MRRIPLNERNGHPRVVAELRLRSLRPRISLRDVRRTAFLATLPKMLRVLVQLKKCFRSSSPAEYQGPNCPALPTSTPHRVRGLEMAHLYLFDGS